MERFTLDTEAFFQSILPLVLDGAAPRLAALPHSHFLLSDDPCPDVLGMASIKKLQLLNRAAGCLPCDGSECYLEVGTFQGKSLIAALVGNPSVSAVACDNFALFDDPRLPQNAAALQRNLTRYGLAGRVQFFECDFKDLLATWHLRQLPAAGVYFYDGAHDEESQYLGIRLAEEVLADNAVVIIDDWRYAEDSHSFAEAGTKKAIGKSINEWSIKHILPARYNGDREQWWNGVAVLSFRRMQRRGQSLPGTRSDC